jgi:hypothetical protein
MSQFGYDLPSAFSIAMAAVLFGTTGLAAAQDGGFKIPTGVHQCELGKSIEVRKVAQDHSSVIIRHGKRDYTLQAVQTNSGALRFEDKKNGRAWVLLVGSSMFLDAKKGQRLASACVA